MKKPKPPCYDEATDTDCPRRKAGCAATCKEWAEYGEKRKKNYAERKTQGRATEDANATLFKHRVEQVKKVQRLRRIKHSR